MIVTVTLNPAIDYHIGIPKMLEGKSLSSNDNSFFAGGKGINVSRVLKNLQYSTVAVALIGGFTGEFILSQASDIIEPVRIKNLNRINTKIKTDTSETEIHGVAPLIDSQEFDTLCMAIQDVSNPQALILSGSIPKSLSSDTYKKLANLCPKGTKIVIDTRGQALKECLSLDSIFLLKPNKDEISEIFGCEPQSTQHALELAVVLKKEHSIEHLILSLGSEGAYFLFNDTILFAEPLKGNLISSVGAGDSVVAGFTAKFLQTDDPIEAFRYGIACGSGTAFSHGLCTFEIAEELFQKVKIQKIK